MKLKFITCSGANETTQISELGALMASFPKMEIGIQVSGKKCFLGSKRYLWIFDLAHFLYAHNILANIALHINSDWVERFCAGETVTEIEQILALKDHLGQPLVNRLQLNFKIGREKTPDMNMLFKVITQHSSQRFILSYNESNADYIQEFYLRGMKFDILCDSSFGEGIIPKERPEQVFTNILQGYAGGLSSKNVTAELQKLADKLPDSAQIYIDAEGKLKDDKGHFDLAKARIYVENALNWEKGHLHQKAY